MDVSYRPFFRARSAEWGTDKRYTSPIPRTPHRARKREIPNYQAFRIYRIYRIQRQRAANT